MEIIQSIEQIRILQTSVREKRNGFLTNFYLDEFKHTIWIQKGVFFYEWVNNTLFFVKKSETFWNVFYTTTTLEVFQLDLQKFKTENQEQTLVFDLVGREAQCLAMIALFETVGFLQSTSLVRMTKTTESVDFIPDETIQFATNEEVQEINSLLHTFFNDKNEQIPFIDELREYAHQKHILVCKENGKIAGFLIFEMNASTLYLRYWFTHPDFRDKKVGSRLLRKFFEIGKETKRQLFWVIRDNENAIVRYKHYGFVEENMFDYVMSNR